MATNMIFTNSRSNRVLLVQAMTTCLHSDFAVNGLDGHANPHASVMARSSSGSCRSHSARMPLRAIACFFLALDSACAFSPAAATTPIFKGSSICGGLHPMVWGWSGRLGHHVPPIRMSDELSKLEQVKKNVLELMRQTFGRDHPETLNALSDYAEVLRQCGHHSEAEPLQKEVLDISKQRYGAGQPEAIKAMDAYADTLTKIGGRDYEVKAMKGGVFQLTQEAFGAEHAETLKALDNFVGVLDHIGNDREAEHLRSLLVDRKVRKLVREAEAEPAKKKLLELTRQKNGREHPDAVSALKNYAATLSRLGREAAALPLKKELLELKRQTCGREHLSSISALTDYADSLGELKREEEAEPLRKEAFELTSQKVGREHSLTHKAMCKYAATLRKLGRESEAEPLQKEVYENRIRIRGSDHPDTIRALNNYADTLLEIDRWPKAEDLKKLGFMLVYNRSGPEHADTLEALDNYASTLFAIGKEAEAEPLKKEVLEVTNRTLGQNHPKTFRALDKYADVLLGLGKKEEAEAMKKYVHELMIKKYGPDHPDTVRALSNHAATLSKIGRQAQAEPLKRKVLDSKRRRLGPDHAETNRALNNYAVTLFELGREFEAEPLMKQVLELTRQNLGPAHPGTLRALSNYAATLKKIGREAEAGLLEDYNMFEGTDKDIVIAMFDFDQTLAQKHVFHTLAQYSTSSTRNPEPDMIGEPIAASPAGQVARLAREGSKYNAEWAFGGKKRIAALRKMLQRLQDREVRMVVCTLGFPAVAKKLLEEVDLLKYFGFADVPRVIGQPGAAYDRHFTTYDAEAAQEFLIVENPDEVLKGSKVALLEELLDKEGGRLKMKLPLSAGVLVEDDPSAVSHAKSRTLGSAYERIVSKGRLHTVEVVDRKGMRAEVEMKDLLNLANA